MFIWWFDWCAHRDVSNWLFLLSPSFSFGERREREIGERDQERERDAQFELMLQWYVHFSRLKFCSQNLSAFNVLQYFIFFSSSFSLSLTLCYINCALWWNYTHILIILFVPLMLYTLPPSNYVNRIWVYLLFFTFFSRERSF